MGIIPSRSKRILHTLMALDRRELPIEVDPIPVFLPDLPEAFHGARIAVVADVHLPDAMVSLSRLVKCVALQQPDAIFLPGDLTNSYTDFAESDLREWAQALAAIAPCYAIPGNHEWRLEREAAYAAILQECGVHYLCDSYADWTMGEKTLRLFGMGKRRPAPLAVKDQPTVVLAHKPEYLPYYQRARWDLVICGHAHGGQIRVAGHSVYAPGQGLFPRYTDGFYTAGRTTMVVSRGLGNSSVPVRLNNRPHLPLVLLMPR